MTGGAIHRPRIAHLAGPTATIQNTPPLVTSNKARARHGLLPLTGYDGAVRRHDALRAQRLAAPAKVYVEQFSAHPMEADAAELYGPPDGYLDASGTFRCERAGEADRPVYEIELLPQDGLYPLPYMARQADGTAWDEECAAPGAAEGQVRQPFYPDGSRSFEEIDRLSVDAAGLASPISARADVDFYRVQPSSGYVRGLPAGERTDVGEGDIPPEVRGREFFPYKPFHLAAAPARPGLARTANIVQRVLDGGAYDGAVWTQGSPQVEETAYWLNLLVDTTLPICCNAAQRPQGQTSHDGPQNILDSVAYIASRVWADGEGRNRAGVVVIQEQQVFAAREVMKVDARPGGYVATGGGGILGSISHHGTPVLQYLPATKYGHLSEVALPRLPERVAAVRRADTGVKRFEVAIKGPDGQLLDGAIPSVSIVKEGSYADEEYLTSPDDQADLTALLAHKLGLGRLASFVIEGLTPYGSMTSRVRELVMLRAVYSGLPVVRTGRGNHQGFADPHPDFIAGSNLTSTKARMLLMACMMKLGSLPPARDPDAPTAAETTALREAVAGYQAIFDTH